MAEREREFRAAILDAPDDIAPRLVYADWLQEQGNVRGEWIALDCVRDTEDDAREMRRRALWQHHGEQWMREDLGYVPNRILVRYRNGFLHSLVTRAPQLLELAPRLARLPIHTLELTSTSSAEMQSFAANPVLAQIRRLELHAHFDDVAATSAVLEAAPRITELRLRRAHGERPNNVWMALEHYAHVEQLVRLALESIEITAVCAGWLVPRLHSIRALQFEGGLQPGSLEVFAARSRPLDELRVEYSPAISDGEWARALEGPWVREIETLALVNCELGAKTGAALRHVAPALLSLDLGQQRSRVAVEAINATFPRVTDLDLGGNTLVDETMTVLRHFPALTTLKLDINKLTNLQTIVEAAPHLVGLDVDATSITDEGIAGVRALPLEMLRLPAYTLGEQAIDLVATLRELRELAIGPYSSSGTDARLRLADAPLDKMEQLRLNGAYAVDANVRFGDGWRALDGATFERNLELSGAVIPNKWK